MSTLTILSDAELDVVSGGILNGGAGGAGGSIVLFNNGNDVSVEEGKIIVVDNEFTANGGHGGNVTIKVSIGSHHR